MATSRFFPAAATRKTWRLLGDLQFICAATESGKSKIFTASWQRTIFFWSLVVALSRFFKVFVFSLLVGTDQKMIFFFKCQFHVRYEIAMALFESSGNKVACILGGEPKAQGEDTPKNTAHITYIYI